MALSTYAELVAAIADRAVAFTGPDTTYYPEFIQSVEAKLHDGFSDPSGRFTIPALRTREMEASDDLAFTDGESDLPDDYLEWRTFDYTTSSRSGLGYVTPGRMTYDYPTVYAGTPGAFSVVGDKVRVRPTGTGTFPFAYYQKIPALTEANATNWLLTKNPFVYLYGALTEAAIYAGEEWAISMYGGLFAGVVRGINTSDKNARWARATARVMGPTP